VQWLQYFLQANGYTDYTFLRGGMAGLDLKTQARKIPVSNSWITFNQQRFTDLVMDT
jgi:hypothetical protein